MGVYIYVDRRRTAALTFPVSGEVEQQDVGAEERQVVQGLELLLQLGVGQLGLQQGGQVSEHHRVQGGRPGGGARDTGLTPPETTYIRPLADLIDFA